MSHFFLQIAEDRFFFLSRKCEAHCGHIYHLIFQQTLKLNWFACKGHAIIAFLNLGRYSYFHSIPDKSVISIKVLYTFINEKGINSAIHKVNAINIISIYTTQITIKNMFSLDFKISTGSFVRIKRCIIYTTLVKITRVISSIWPSQDISCKSKTLTALNSFISSMIFHEQLQFSIKLRQIRVHLKNTQDSKQIQ